MAITDYNANADLNVSISGINIAEGCPPGNINNAIRQVMADMFGFGKGVGLIDADGMLLTLSELGIVDEEGNPLSSSTDPDPYTLVVRDENGNVKTGLPIESDDAIPYILLKTMVIGVPMYWRSTTLPPNCCWPNGDLISFADWPDIAEIYNGGGFSGMLLAYNADSATIAANLGKWRPNAASPTGLFAPNYGDQFFRNWIAGLTREAGTWQEDAVQQGITDITSRPLKGAPDNSSGPWGVGGNVLLTRGVNNVNLGMYDGGAGNSFNWAVQQRFADETRPSNIAVPVILYLGRAA